jgi:hypothetical protein
MLTANLGLLQLVRCPAMYRPVERVAIPLLAAEAPGNRGLTRGDLVHECSPSL